MNQPMKLLATVLATAAALPVMAGVSADDARKLGTTLTAVGAEAAANKDGSIPAYTGGLTTAPAGYKKGDGIRPDPYAADKPVLSIDARSMDKHADKLTEGVKALMKKYPSYRIDVYPTRRSAAFPKYVTENTARCAVSAKTTNNGLTMEGCHAGFPFPLPKDGYEAMWNHLVRFNGPAYGFKFGAYNVTSAGTAVLSTQGNLVQEFPYWDNSRKDSDVYYRLKVSYSGPARRAGEALLVIDPLDPVSKGRRAWQYLPGQRRVKLAPDVSFDTPNPGTAGASTYDDTFVFNGSMERFNFKLVGKKEVYIPYNTYKMAYGSTVETLLTPKHLNPDLVRWELHRVWVVEATLAEGKRHVYSKRTFYVDEDSWVAVASDEYDGRGQLYRAGFNYVTPSYDLPAPFADLQGHYDLVSGIYTINGYTAPTGGVRYVDFAPQADWAPEALAGSGVR